MGGDVEVVARLRLEALQAAPGGILDLEEGSVCDEYHVEKTVGDDHVLCSLDDAWQDSDCRGERGVALREDIDLAAFGPLDGRGVDRLLYI